jgi:energy-coupling factor transport system ATP-binding protein
MAPLVDIAGLRYRYPEGAELALDGIDLVLDGGLCVVAGPSGGGKSTLLRLLNGLVPHMYGGHISGRAAVDGHDILRTPARRLARSVGFVFQDAERQAVHATVARDVAFGLENLGVPAPMMRSRVDDILERLSIAHLRDRTIATLSGGERQRVAVAGALVLRPRLLVLDEPFSQLDSAGAAALLCLCLELRDAGTAVVVSEHRLDEVLPVADTLAIIAAGRLEGPAAPSALAARLDSAPQVVRLSGRLGISPPLLDPATLDLGARAVVAPKRCEPAARASEPAWRIEGVDAGHDDLLRGVTVGGARGEVIAVMGRNGSGKTTLLRLIAGLLPARAGEVWRAPGRVSYLPQNPAALLHRETVGAEIAWTLRGDRRGNAADPSHDEVARILGLTPLLDRDPRDLSSGQRQRVAVAAILCGSPQIALLDEPTRGMDGATREGLVTAIAGLAAAGTSVVIATHDCELAASVADRVLVIDDHRVHDRGAPRASLSGAHEHATQLGRLFSSPGPVTVEAVAALLEQPRSDVRVTR